VLRDGCSRLLIKCWAGCDSVELLADLQRRGLIVRQGNGAEQPGPATARSDGRVDVVRRTASGLRIWNAAGDARGSPLVRYLAGRHIISLIPGQCATCLSADDDLISPLSCAWDANRNAYDRSLASWYLPVSEA
jgi:hypothetical protein